MPVYEYKCRQCGEKFETMRSMNAGDDEVSCPKCGAKKPVKIFSAVCGHSADPNRGNLRFPT
jgi:putative FmdB family regulatory protein